MITIVASLRLSLRPRPEARLVVDVELMAGCQAEIQLGGVDPASIVGDMQITATIQASADRWRDRCVARFSTTLSVTTGPFAAARLLRSRALRPLRQAGAHQASILTQSATISVMAGKAQWRPYQ